MLNYFLGIPTGFCIVPYVFFLIFSRPTAVNLGDAAIKLKEIVSRAAAISSEASSVFQVWICSFIWLFSFELLLVSLLVIKLNKC